MKIDAVYQEYTLKELQKFQYRLSRALHVSPLALRLCQVEEGCLLLLFQVPSFVELEVFPLSSEQERALAAKGVIRLWRLPVCCQGLYSPLGHTSLVYG